MQTDFSLQRGLKACHQLWFQQWKGFQGPAAAQTWQCHCAGAFLCFLGCKTGFLGFLSILWALGHLKSNALALAELFPLEVTNREEPQPLFERTRQCYRETLKKQEPQVQNPLRKYKDI